MKTTALITSFTKAGLLSLGLLAAPARAQEEITNPAYLLDDITIAPDLCAQPDPTIYEDDTGKAWKKVETNTTDQLPLSFDLHVDIVFPKDAESYDSLSCHDVRNQILTLAANFYSGHIIRFAYKDLPENTPAIPQDVIARLNKLMTETLPVTTAPLIKGLEFQNVNAPGLDPEMGKAMLAQEIGYDYTAFPDPEHGYVLTYDDRYIAYDLDINFMPLAPAWYALGPNDEGVERNVLAAIHTYIKAEMGQRRATCVVDDIDYIIANAFLAATENETLERFINLHNITVTDLALLPQFAGSVEANDIPSTRPQDPVCVSALERRYGRFIP